MIKLEEVPGWSFLFFGCGNIDVIPADYLSGVGTTLIKTQSTTKPSIARAGK